MAKVTSETIQFARDRVADVAFALEHFRLGREEIDARRRIALETADVRAIVGAYVEAPSEQDKRRIFIGNAAAGLAWVLRQSGARAVELERLTEAFWAEVPGDVAPLVANTEIVLRWAAQAIDSLERGEAPSDCPRLGTPDARPFRGRSGRRPGRRVGSLKADGATSDLLLILDNEPRRRWTAEDARAVALRVGFGEHDDSPQAIHKDLDRLVDSGFFDVIDGASGKVFQRTLKPHPFE